jgi:recombination protein RecT
VSNIALIEQDVYSTKDSFLSVLTDRSINFEREAGFAVQSILGNDYATKIAVSNRQSVINAVTNVAAIGISLNPAKKQAYLVPRDGKICLDISYIGLMDLAMDTGSLRWAQAALVHANDVVGVYVVVKTAHGEYLTTTMSVDEINAIRDRSSAWKAWVANKKSCPWVTDWGEMAKKTCVKRAYKFWPKTERLEQAIHYLNTETNEGLSDVRQLNYAPSADVGKWVSQANACTTKEALEATWKNGGNVLREAGDRQGYAKLKEAVVARLATLSAPIEAEPTGDVQEGQQEDEA